MELAEIELKDDETNHGGKSFSEETFKDFASYFDLEELEESNTVESFNKSLIDCGILPLTELNYPNVTISDEAINELLNTVIE